MKDTPVMHTLDRNWGDALRFITVRRGRKYVGTKGTTYELCECTTHGADGSPHHEVVGMAIVTGTKLFRLNAIPASLLALHYNEECTSWDGLCEALEKAYGEVTGNQEFTVVELMRI